MKHLLVVDADNVFRETLVKALKAQGIRVTGIGDPDLLASTVAIQRPDVVLLEMTFNGEVNGPQLCQKFRTWSTVPLIIISELDDEMTKVQVLDAGADDYLIKPFGVHELLARIRAIQRRMTGRNSLNSHVITIDDLSIDFESWQVKLKGAAVRLTRKEFQLLKILADAQGRLVKYKRLLDEIWPDEETSERSKVRALVMQVRNKLQEDLSNPRYILTEAGVGYRLNVNGMLDSLA